MKKALFDETLEKLAKHHGDVEKFALKMFDNFKWRYGSEFWSYWESWIPQTHGLVIDMGTGPGLFPKALVQRYPQMKVIGVDVAPWMEAHHSALLEFSNIHMVHMDLNQPHFNLKDRSVDVILASAVLHELKQPMSLLWESQRLLKEGGKFIIMDWVQGSLQTYAQTKGQWELLSNPQSAPEDLEKFFQKFAEHNRWTLEDLILMLKLTGFKVLNRETFHDNRFVRLICEKS